MKTYSASKPPVRYKSPGSTSKGFVLFPQDLLGLHAEILNCMAKTKSQDALFQLFEVRVKSGMTTQFETLDEVFQLPNFEDDQLIELTLNYEKGKAENHYHVIIKFTARVESESKALIPCSWSINGATGDWISIASHSIEKKLSPLWRVRFDDLTSRSPLRLIVLLGIPVGMLVSLVLLTSSITDSQLRAVESFERLLDSGSHVDPARVLIGIEKARLTRTITDPFKIVIYATLARIIHET